MWARWDTLWVHPCFHYQEAGYKPQYDGIFVNTNKLVYGMVELNVAWEILYFLVTMNCKKYPCALVHWYSLVGDSSNEITSMWVIKHEVVDGKPQTAVIHIDTVLHLAHWLPIYNDKPAPRGIEYTDSLDTFSEFYISRFVDHHACEISL